MLASAIKWHNSAPSASLRGSGMPGDRSHPTIYEPLSHTADLGMLVYGRDVQELFAHAAWGMFDLISDAQSKLKENRPAFAESSGDGADTRY